MLRSPNVFRAPPRTLSAAEFERALRAHEAFVSGRPGGARAILRLVVAHLMRADRRQLHDVEFTGSDLSGTTFIATDLRRASFYCANLSRCDLRASNLSRADLRGANLGGARLMDAVLDEADMRSAILAASDDLQELRWIGGAGSLAGARMAMADLSGAMAHSVDFTNCSLKGAKLRNANLKFANFTNANLAGAQLAGAKLEGITLTGAVMTGMDVERLGLSPASLTTCVTDPSEAALAQADVIRAALDRMDEWVATSGRRGSHLTLDGRDLRPVAGQFRGRALPGLSAKAAVAIDVDFAEAELAGANFEGADLRGASFAGADLRGVNFRGANLAHARMEGAKLASLPLVNGRVRTTVLDGAILVGTGLRPVDPGANRLVVVD